MSIEIVSTNRKARKNYQIFDTYEAGIVLVGSEMKSVREHRVNIDDSFCLVENGEIFAHNIHISPYFASSVFRPDPDRKRKLLLHRKEIDRIAGQVARKGFALIPLKVYIKNNKWCKVEIGVCKGKKEYDKREDLKKKDIELEMKRVKSKYL
ncbi:MAG: SsrA-binding protein SmpB [Spirochaetia bacterium]|nr:SsrA-binding protein SmpB [Spirochaetota bacterium]MCX8096310.1 SsrA-binding protein SmpB [Spirochaetota bacterium]MDW8112329.1 SsrA-binding protein SmpB [Spirochaetia bacterium]